jgi:parvulin-like peptidyl-prolyl isomerase
MGSAEPPPGAREAQIEAGPGVIAELKPCEGAQPLATVGEEWILAVEVLGMVNQVLDPYKNKLSAAQLEEQKQLLIQQLLQDRIKTKLIYLDAKRTIPAENLPKVEAQIGDFFEKEELPAMLKRGKVGTRQELDAKLQAFGTSVDRQKRSFIEQALAQQWAREQMKGTGEVTHEQMLDYYQEHASEYEHQAQVRWEQLMVRFSDFPNRQEAWKALAQMGNQVLGGVPLAEVAKARSKGPTATSGGMRDWTRQGSLVSESLNQALFTLPIGQLSQILEDKQGLHIIRVVERKEAGRTPFLEAQTEIREKIKEERKRKKYDDYLARLRKQTPVWTIFDNSNGNPLVSQAETTKR